MCRTSCIHLNSCRISLIRFPYLLRGDSRTSAVPINYLSSTSPSSQTGGRLIILTNTNCQILSATKKNASTISNLILISQLYHFTFVSALLLPVLRLNLVLPLRLQGLGTRRLVRPYPDGFPTIFYQLTKALQNLFCSLGKISYADFAARTVNYSIPHFYSSQASLTIGKAT